MPLTQVETTAHDEDGVEFDGGRLARAAGDATVADAMVRRPKILPATATSDDVRDLFGDDRVHAALVVDEDRLLTVVERHEAETRRDGPARTMGTLRGRTIVPDADLWETWVWMTGVGCRRLAVVEDGRFLGLLCLKRSGLGFCCDAGIRAMRQAQHDLSQQELTWEE